MALYFRLMYIYIMVSSSSSTDTYTQTRTDGPVEVRDRITIRNLAHRKFIYIYRLTVRYEIPMAPVARVRQTR